MDKSIPPKNIKCVLLGNSGTGKTSIVLRYVRSEFQQYQTQTTLGASLLEKLVQVGDQKYRLQIWDTAGQEKFHSLAPMYYRDADAALLVYDVTFRESFDSLKKWIDDLKVQGPYNLNKILVLALAGNKSDLEEQEEVDFEEVQKYCQENNACFRYTSAKENKGINELFIKIIETFEQKQQEDASTYSSRRITLDPFPKQNLNLIEKKKSCC